MSALRIAGLATTGVLLVALGVASAWGVLKDMDAPGMLAYSVTAFICGSPGLAFLAYAVQQRSLDFELVPQGIRVRGETILNGDIVEVYEKWGSSDAVGTFRLVTREGKTIKIGRGLEGYVEFGVAASIQIQSVILDDFRRRLAAGESLELGPIVFDDSFMEVAIVKTPLSYAWLIDGKTTIDVARVPNGRAFATLLYERGVLGVHRKTGAAEVYDAVKFVLDVVGEGLQRQ